MAIVIRGKSVCDLCERIMEDGQDIIAFSPFVYNEFDPLLLFSDAAFHKECFLKHSLAEKALARVEEQRKRIGPGNRFCIVCDQEITNPNEYFAFIHLTDDRKHPLYKYNYIQFHRSCLPQWTELSQVYDHLKELQHSGAWKGKVLDWLVAEMKRVKEEEMSGRYR